MTFHIEMFKVSNGRINNQCYLVYLNGKGILIDPAWDFQLINRFITINNIELIGVLLTHSHEDHIDLAQRFTEEYNCQAYMSSIEIDFYEVQITNLKPVFHLEQLIIDEFCFTPILTPGHTVGSTCYLLNNNLFSGDTFFIEGVGICNTKGGDVNKLFDSVQFIKDYLGPSTKFWPGHTFGIEAGQDLYYLLENNIYFMLTNRNHFTQLRMRKRKKFSS